MSLRRTFGIVLVVAGGIALAVTLSGLSAAGMGLAMETGRKTDVGVVLGAMALVVLLGIVLVATGGRPSAAHRTGLVRRRPRGHE